ncbi:MAG: SPOR domain-containing protein [Gemmatimonadota bacterium]
MPNPELTFPTAPGGMRDLELDDLFWREALAALQSGAGAAALAERHPAYAGLLADLAGDTCSESCVIGIRLAASGKNPRLFALLTAAFLARGGTRTLFLDLSPELRWLEHLLGQDLKEGLVDHLQFGVPLERCVHATALRGLSVASGGAYFLAGSALDDARAFRGALEALRQGGGALVMTLPQPLEQADEAGLSAICHALVTVEDPESPAPLVGSERLVVRLTGNPQAAWELAQLTHRYLGPLPALLAAGDAARGRGGPLEHRASRHEEPAAPAAPRSAHATQPPRAPLAARMPEPSIAPAAPRGARRARPGGARWIVAVAAGIVLIAAAAAIGLGSGRLAPLFAGGGDDGAAVRAADVEEPMIALAADAGEPRPVEEAEPESLVATAHSAAAATVAADSAPAFPPGRPAPFSVHVGSYQSGASGGRLVAQIAAAGYAAFLAPVVIPGKGEWHRVYVGAFPDAAAAQRALARLVGAGLVEEGVVQPTPLAFPLGTFATRAAADARRMALRRQGISAYAIGSDPVRLYAGAYQTEDDAALLARALAAADAPATLTQREE